LTFKKNCPDYNKDTKSVFEKRLIMRKVMKKIRNERPAREKNLGLFMSPDLGQGGGGFLVPMTTLEVGPGEPGPGDDWKMPKESTKKV
jgi:hypothetical protein